MIVESEGGISEATSTLPPGMMREEGDSLSPLAF